MKKNIHLALALSLVLGFVSCGVSKQVTDNRSVKERVESHYLYAHIPVRHALCLRYAPRRALRRR